MSILGALKARHDREAQAGGGSVPGFAPAKIHFTVVLSPDGTVVTVEREVRDGKGKRLLKEPLAPQAPKRTVAVVSGTFWDKTSYVFGRTAPDAAASETKQARDAVRCAQEHAAFKARHETLLAASDDAGCQALLAFLRSWDPSGYDALDHAGDMLDQNVAFRLEEDMNLFLHDRPGAQAALAAGAEAPADGAGERCLVTGTLGPIARLHPSIKGVPGAQSSGAALVSFNLDAFNSYGRTQGFNAPVSEAVAFAYGRALNDLLSAEIGRDKKDRPLYANRIGLGADTVVFWADTSQAEAIVRGAFSMPPPDDRTETEKVRTVMQRIEGGAPINDATLETQASTRVYALGLSPNAARLSVRFWLEDTLGDFATRFQEHWDDMRIEPKARAEPPPVWALLYELAPRREIDEGLRQLAGELTRSIVTGDRYPRTLVARILMRMRAETDRKDDKTGQTIRVVSALRVSMLKACLARDFRKGLLKENVPVALDLNNENVGYRLGRLFAILERLQRAALGQRNATIRDRYYAAMSATPERIFPVLIRGARAHGKRVRSSVGAPLAEWFENRIAECLSTIDAVPSTLNSNDQVRFALGYYHQRDALFAKKSDLPPEIAIADNIADDTGTDENGDA